MKRKLLLIIIFIPLFVSFSNEQNKIKNLIKCYQDNLNSYNNEKVIELFETNSKASIQLVLKYLNSYKDNGIITNYKIDVTDIKVYESIAEVKLKTSVTYSGENKQTVNALQLLSPPMIDTIMTLRKTDNKWKIVSEKEI